MSSDYIKTISKKLILNKQNIWQSIENKSVSFPEFENNNSFLLKEDSFWYKHRNNVILYFIKKYLKTQIFFDIGGGNGIVSALLLNLGIDTFLIEPDYYGIINARSRGVKNLINTTFEDAQFLDNSIPAIGIFDVLEHIENDVIFLKDIKNSLINSGLLYITVPTYNICWSNEAVRLGHFRRYNVSQLISILKKLDFEIIDWTYFFSFLPFPIFLLRTIPYFLKIRDKNDYEISINEDNPKSKLINKFLDIILNFELQLLEANKKIRIGSSCIVVCKNKK